MVVLGSDDGLIASGERTFISGSPRPCRCVLNAVLGHLESWTFHNSSTESPSQCCRSLMNTMCVHYNYGTTAACSRITEAITTLSSSVRDLSDHQAGGTCMGAVDTSSRYREGDCLREKGPLFPWPHLALHWGPAVNFEFQFPVSSLQSPFPVPVPAL